MSLSLIAGYGSSDSDDDDIEQLMELSEEEEDNGMDLVVLEVVNSLVANVERQFGRKFPFATTPYRCQANAEDEDDSDSDSSISDEWSLSVESDDYDDECDVMGNGKTKQAKHCVTKGEMTVDDLPPIESLHISVDVRYLTQVGIVSSMIDQLVVIQSFKNIPVLDLDTVLFCKEGTSIGQIFDVIGPVKQPNYVLRFNSPEEVLDSKLLLNSPVYYAEGQQQNITKYVFIQQLEKERGSDASWKHNNEPPPDEVDFSDDEVERAEKWKKKAKSRRK